MTRYRTIVVDPPWPYAQMSKPWRTTVPDHYPLASLDDIKALPVGDLAEKNAHLYMWAVLPMIAEAYDVIRQWGFQPSTMLTWCKPGPGLGAGFRGNTEHLIVAQRGSRSCNPTCAACGDREHGARKCACLVPEWRFNGIPLVRDDVLWRAFQGSADGTWYVAPRGRHSAKPELFLDLIERMSPGPYLELFARRNRLGWDTWGNEALEHVEMDAS